MVFGVLSIHLVQDSKTLQVGSSGLAPLIQYQPTETEAFRVLATDILICMGSPYAY